MPREPSREWRVLLTAHVFDKIRAIDMTLAEFEHLLDTGQVVEERQVSRTEVKELVCVLEWLRPLHVVVVVDTAVRERRIVTVYEPDPGLWTSDFRRRRR